MTTPAEFTAWLISDTARPVALVEAEYASGTEYLATDIFISGAHDTPAHQIYLNAIANDVVIDDHIDRGSYGAIEIVHDGEFDAWVDRAWAGHPLRVYLGDRSWDRDDFVLMVKGKNGGVSARAPGRLKMKWRDRREALRQAVIGDSSTAIIVGECYNVPALMTADTPSYTFSVNDGAITSHDLRDNGVAMTEGSGNDYVDDLVNGEFDLESGYGDPVGQICSNVVQADSTLEDAVTNLCGRASIDVDATNLAAFPSSAKVGIFINSATSLENALQELTQSLGAVITFNTDDELQLFRFEEPAVTADFTLIADDIARDGVSLQQIEPPFKKTTLRYRKNFAPQSVDSLSGSLNQAEKDDLTVEYLEVSATNTLPDYPLAGERVIDTLIANAMDAQTECNRRDTLRDKSRMRHQVNALYAGAEIPLGATVDITFPYRGFETGQKVLVIGNKRELIKRRARLTVWH